jgi:hypothetical protein
MQLLFFLKAKITDFGWLAGFQARLRKLDDFAGKNLTAIRFGRKQGTGERGLMLARVVLRKIQRASQHQRHQGGAHNDGNKEGVDGG